MKIQLIKIATISLLLGLVAMSSAQDNTRRSTTGICHQENESPYYDRLKYFETFDTYNQCFYYDGRARAGNDTIPKYQRRYFGTGWGDVDGDGQNTRAEVLLEQSLITVRFRDNNKNVVDSGKWISIFTNEELYSASNVDVDHLIPLSWAWQHGAFKWDYEKRQEFANDMRNLAPVEKALNRSKGARGPDAWLPPVNRCGYMLRFIRIYKSYGLYLSEDEQEDYNFILDDICGRN